MDANGRGARIEAGMSMTEKQDNLAREREEIATRVAKFKATQEKFKREREEYCVTTLQNAGYVKRQPHERASNRRANTDV